VSEQGVTFHLTYNRSSQRRVFPGNPLHQKQGDKTLHTSNTKH